jgi:hypothetical protein
MSQLVQELEAQVSAELEAQKRQIVHDRAQGKLAEKEADVNRRQEELGTLRSELDADRSAVAALLPSAPASEEPSENPAEFQAQG